MSAPKPREAIRAALERFADPEIEWELDPTVSIDQKAYHGIDDVVEWFEVLLEAFEQAGQVPERFIDCGDQVLVFIRGEWRGRPSGLEINEQWTHLHPCATARSFGCRCSEIESRPSKPPGCGSRRRDFLEAVTGSAPAKNDNVAGDHGVYAPRALIGEWVRPHRAQGRGGQHG